MWADLSGITIAVLGGDARELVVVEKLAASGARVNVSGLPLENKAGIAVFSDPGDCLENARAVILPVPGVDEKGFVYCALSKQSLVFSSELAARIPPGAPVFVGTVRPLLARIASQAGLRLVELMKLNEVAILNSIPSAEGAVQMAMEIMPVTIHGSSAFVLGFGRTGTTLARLLGAMGAKTTVVARRPEHLARISEMSLTPVPFHRMSGSLGEADVIFNTIPAPVLTREVLEKVAPDALIIDLASSPGGTDFHEAGRLGIKAVLAPGLPGKVAPKTAGSILAMVITRLLTEEIAGS